MSAPEIVPTFHGEVQLASWSETHNGGAKIVLWLADPSDLDVFRTLTLRKGNTAGQRFMVAMVEIDDDEQPVQPPPAKPEPEKGGALANLAGMWCDAQEFWLFLRAQRCPCGSAKEAAEIIYHVCKVKSRAELDHNEEAARIFQEKFRGPFMRWKQGAR